MATKTGEIAAVKEELRSIVAEQRSIIAELRELEKWKPLGAEEREQLRDRLEALSDSELVRMFMTAHKLIEQRAAGRTRTLLERQTVLVTTVLIRFAPDAFADALAVWGEHEDEGTETGLASKGH